MLFLCEAWDFFADKIITYGKLSGLFQIIQVKQRIGFCLNDSDRVSVGCRLVVEKNDSPSMVWFWFYFPCSMNPFRAFTMTSFCWTKMCHSSKSSKKKSCPPIQWWDFWYFLKVNFPSWIWKCYWDKSCTRQIRTRIQFIRQIITLLYFLKWV